MIQLLQCLLRPPILDRLVTSGTALFLIIWTQFFRLLWNVFWKLPISLVFCKAWTVGDSFASPSSWSPPDTAMQTSVPSSYSYNIFAVRSDASWGFLFTSAGGRSPSVSSGNTKKSPLLVGKATILYFAVFLNLWAISAPPGMRNKARSTWLSTEPRFACTIPAFKVSRIDTFSTFWRPFESCKYEP